YDVVLEEDKVEIAKKVLEAMLAIWSAIHKAGKENQETLRRFAEKLDIKITTPKDADVSERSVDSGDSFTGRLT
ncbi:MAG: hypothetical protein ACRDJ9_22960, partial [Dehalococcoidia bacterium]